MEHFYLTRGGGGGAGAAGRSAPLTIPEGQVHPFLLSRARFKHGPRNFSGVVHLKLKLWENVLPLGRL